MSVTTATNLETVSATLTVTASASRVFAVLADPTTHAAIDGTGWVQEAGDRAPLTEAEQVFRMDDGQLAELAGPTS